MNENVKYTDSQGKALTGYPSIDKPWLKYYSREAVCSSVPDCTAYEYIYNLNTDNMSHTALNYFGRAWTYEMMFKEIDRTERALEAAGVRSGDIVSLSLPNMPESVFLYYALSKMGAVANMIDPRTGAAGIVKYINEADSTMFIAIDALIPITGSLLHDTKLKNIVFVSPVNSLSGFVKFLYRMKGKRNTPTDKKVKIRSWDEFSKEGCSKSNNESKFSGDTPSLIVHTGGTTGTPKGVVLSNTNINAMAHQSRFFPTDLRREHRWLDIMPPFIAYGIGSGLHFPLAVGMEVVLIPKLEPDELDRLVIKYKPNHICGTPVHWRYFIKSDRLKRRDLSYLITCAVGGDALDVETEKKANNFLKSHGCKYAIAKGYGMTEVNGSISRTTLDDDDLGSVGIPFVNSIVSIFDVDTGDELGYGKQGEVCMTGPSVMLGYYKNAEQTDLILRTHKDGSKWIHSGDIGYMNRKGNLFIVGRMKRIIIRNDGFKVFPSMLEAVISLNPKVQSCCVVGKPDTQHNQGAVPVAYIQLDTNVQDADEIKRELVVLCNKELPEYAQPVDFVFVEKIPLTPIGKVDYRKLEEQASKM